MCTSVKGVTDGSIDSVQQPIVSLCQQPVSTSYCSINSLYVVNCRTLNSFVTILLALWCGLLSFVVVFLNECAQWR